MIITSTIFITLKLEAFCQFHATPDRKIRDRILGTLLLDPFWLPVTPWVADTILEKASSLSLPLSLSLLRRLDTTCCDGDTKWFPRSLNFFTFILFRGANWWAWLGFDKTGSRFDLGAGWLQKLNLVQFGWLDWWSRLHQHIKQIKGGWNPNFCNLAHKKRLCNAAYIAAWAPEGRSYF